MQIAGLAAVRNAKALYTCLETAHRVKNIRNYLLFTNEKCIEIDSG